MTKVICPNCGVELDTDMAVCPLCNGEDMVSKRRENHLYLTTQKMEIKHKKFVWEIVSIILFSSSVSVLLIDLNINKTVLWSQYPVAINLVIFSYVSMFAFGRGKVIIKLIASLALASLSFIVLDLLDGSLDWSLTLGIPLLLVLNGVFAILLFMFNVSTNKGVNLIAYVFLGLALVCLCIEGILSLYFNGILRLEWSVIVSGSVLPVTLVLFFIHFRMKRGKNLDRTFHL